MRLTDEMMAEDDKRFVRKDILNEFNYCGKEVPLRKSITNDEIRFYAWLCRSAYTLLKEQEAKPPAIMQDIEGIWSTCSMCGHKLRPILAMKMDTYLPKFCSKCGQAVKWE